MQSAIRRASFLFAVLIFALQSWAQAISPEEKDEILKALGTIVTERAFVPGVDMSRWPTFVERHMDAIDDTEQMEPFARAVNIALNDFGLSHLRFRSPAATKQRETNSVVGLGIVTQKEEDRLVVVDTVPSGPAAEAGLQPGDKIIEVDGHKPGDPGELRGDAGTEVKLKIAKADGTEVPLTIKRRQVSMSRADTLTFPEPDVAVLHIHTFATGYNPRQIEDLVQQAADHANYLIIDLRSNGGGATNNLRHFLSQVLPGNSVIGTFVSRRAVTEYENAGEGEGADVVEVAKWWSNKFRTATREPQWVGKMAVLINRGSASASEIAAAALHELVGAPLIGQRSAGAVLASVYGNLPHGFSVQYPIDDYVTAKGERLEKAPRKPDITVASPRRGNTGPDLAIQKAIAILKGDADSPTAPAEPEKPAAEKAADSKPTAAR
jgi:carboxyl-terminal processing protease